MQLHELQRTHKHRRSIRVGRGGKRGKTSGRGHKGQKARAGHRIRPEIRDVISRVPKLRGHGKNRARTVRATRPRAFVVSLSALDSAFAAGEAVSPRALSARGVLRAHKSEPARPVKILANGSLSKKLTVAGCLVSAAARAKIEQQGGNID